MAESPVPPSGGHQIEPAFGAVAELGPAPEPKPHRRRTGLILTLLGVLLIGAACAGTQWAANVGYDDALVAFEDAEDDAEVSQAELERALLALTETTEVATTVAETDSGTLMDAASKEPFAAALSEAEAAETEAVALVDDELPEATDKPDWAWELFGATSELNADRDELAEDEDEFDDTRSTVTTASDAVNETGTAAILSAAEAAGAFEAAHVSARNTDIIAMRRAAERVSGATALDATAAEAYAELESAAEQMLASEQAELAEKQGPLHDARVEIEAFARDLAPGVLLDFDWSPLVNGYGEADSMGGYATWWYGDPGYANLELSNSVAQYWPGDRSKALVAHEVGHAISVKCEGMYDDTDQGTIEAWATAWAIGMGFHDAANGTSAYGAPPQSLIDAAAACR
ncbi:hypothetical protein [Microbacterium abyssi]|uniref:hypothetical protein n=1 Tax=Microbacterium abyssi TaxID=2782166 RepID=UPI0018872B1E|nr:hypothetical protein [Microbacterium sp. A18JL241]